MIPRERIDKSLNRFHFHSGIVLNNLPVDQQEILNENFRKVNLKKKQVLFRQGSYPTGVYVLLSGKLKVYQLNYDGSVQILFIYSPGEVFGYRPVISGETHPVSVAALEDSELQFIDSRHFMNLLESSIELKDQMLISLCREFTVLTNRINVFAQRGIKERLALALLILNEKFKSRPEVEEFPEIILTRTDLANFVGTSLENLVRTIRFFKEKKLISTKGKSITIRHLENLFILSGID